MVNLKHVRRTRRQATCAIALAPIFGAIYACAFWLRYDSGLGPNEVQMLQATVLTVVMAKCALFAWFRVFQSWSRYVTFHDLVSMAQAAAGSSLLIVMADHFIFYSYYIPRSVVLMDCGGTLLTVGGLRGLWRILREGRSNFYHSALRTHVMIVGANDSGESLLRSLRLNDSMHYQVIGFVGESDLDAHRLIAGVPVIGTIDETCHLAEKYGATEVYIAGDIPGRKVRRLIDECRKAEISVKVLPSYNELLTGRLDTRPREVSIEDLLRRDPVQLDIANIREWIDDRVVLVTGSCGSIGSEICRQILQFAPRQLVMVDRSENGQFHIGREFAALTIDAPFEVLIADLNDAARMESIFDRWRPEVVFHAAAYKHVPLMEAHPGEAVKNTVLATQRIANLARDYDVRSFVMISTDKAVNPTSVMGACKRVAELYVQSLAAHSDCRFVTVRFGNVLDSAGSVVPVFREQIEAGGPVTVTHPRMERFFMTIPEAAQLVIQAGAMGRGGEIYVLDMGEPVRIVDLAADLIRLSGFEVGEDIEIEFVGLRPGEKLFEELHIQGEEPLPTCHPKITIARCHTRSHAMISHEIDQLRAVTEQPAENILLHLSRMLPEYQNSHAPMKLAALAA